MKKRNLISVALLLFSGHVYAASGSGNISNVQNMGGSTLQNSVTCVLPAGAQPITLWAGDGAHSTGNRMPFIYGGSAYKVTAGKTFYGCGFWFNSDTASNFSTAFGETLAAITNNSAFVGTETLFAPTTTLTDSPVTVSVPTANVYQFFNFPLTFSASTFPFVRQGGSVAIRIIMIGYEL